MAPAWTHLGFAVPAGVFGQETLDLFDDGADRDGEDGAGAAGKDSASEWISNTQ
jgi:Holliday junction DNA helicase RuvB